MIIPALRITDFQNWLNEIRHIADAIQFNKGRIYTIEDCQGCYVNQDEGWATMPGLEGISVNNNKVATVFTDGLHTRLSQMREDNMDIRSYLKAMDLPDKIFLDVGQFEYHKHIVDEVAKARLELQLEHRISGHIDPDVIRKHTEWSDNLLSNIIKTPAGNRMAYQWFAGKKDQFPPVPGQLHKPDARLAPITIQMVEEKFRPQKKKQERVTKGKKIG